MKSYVDDFVWQFHKSMQWGFPTGDPACLFALELIPCPRRERRSHVTPACAEIRDYGIDNLAGFALEKLEALLLADAVNDDDADFLDVLTRNLFRLIFRHVAPPDMATSLEIFNRKLQGLYDAPGHTLIFSSSTTLSTAAAA